MKTLYIWRTLVIVSDFYSCDRRISRFFVGIEYNFLLHLLLVSLLTNFIARIVSPLSPSLSFSLPVFFISLFYHGIADIRK